MKVRGKQHSLIQKKIIVPWQTSKVFMHIVINPIKERCDLIVKSWKNVLQNMFLKEKRTTNLKKVKVKSNMNTNSQMTLKICYMTLIGNTEYIACDVLSIIYWVCSLQSLPCVIWPSHIQSVPIHYYFYFGKN